jgi:dephospho-CoA kinase
VLLVGLTGNFGMGKSFVLDTFEELGAFTVDADEVVHELLEEKPVLEKIRQLLGDEVFDGEGNLLKDKMADKIFAEETLRFELENLLHPLVFERIFAMLEEAKPSLAVVEASLIFERGYDKKFYKTITVYTDEETAIGRLEAEGIDRQAALDRLKWQLPIEEKKRLADFSINNSGSPEDTERKTKEIYSIIAEEARIRSL